jgi:lipopolysaccharide/colanic/teichoic acid biosynthesis glycosyltransferase
MPFKGVLGVMMPILRQERLGPYWYKDGRDVVFDAEVGDQSLVQSPALDEHAAGQVAPPQPVLCPYTRTGYLIKTVTDRILAAIGLVITLPLLIIIAIAIRIDSTGPAIFQQQRVGKGGKLFTFYKFRGMYVDGMKRFPHLYDYNYSQNEIKTLYFHIENDPRVTRVGRFLRRTSLDELPNLINVVLGDMSLVGPRPEIPEFVQYYGDLAEVIFSVKPGITSLAKSTGRDELNFYQTMTLDAEYLATRSVRGDFAILLKTVLKIVTGRNRGL